MDHQYDTSHMHNCNTEDLHDDGDCRCYSRVTDLTICKSSSLFFLTYLLEIT